MARSLEDTIAEPRRAPLVPGPGGDQAGGRRRRRARLQPVRIRAVAVRAVPRRGDRRARVAAAMTAAVSAHIGGEPQTYVSPIAPQRRARRLVDGAS